MTIPFGMFDPAEEERKKREREAALSSMLFKGLPGNETKPGQLPTVFTTAKAPTDIERGIANMTMAGTKKESPYGGEEGLSREQQQQLERARLARGMADTAGELFGRLPADFAPVSGEILSGMDAKKEFDEGNYGWAALNAAGAIPIAGTVVRGAKALGKGLDAAGTFSRSVAERELAQLVTGLRSLPWEKALKNAKRGDHLIPLPEGGYVGAPDAIKNASDLGAMRRRVDGTMEAGAEGRSWYDRARESITKMFPGNTKAQTEMAQNLGTYSAQADPGTNLGFSLRQQYAKLAGDRDFAPRFPNQRDKFWRMVDSGKRMESTPKIGPYTDNIDPTLPHTGMGVNDIQHGRNFGFRNPDGSLWDSGYTLSEHGWMDGETRLMADRANQKAIAGATDWTPEQAQASAWIYEKAREAVAKGKFGGDMNKAMEWANQTYQDFFPKHTLFATHEQIPGAATGHLKGITEAPADVRKQYSEVTGWRDGNDRDVLYAAAEAPNLEMNSGVGTFRAKGTGELETNPLEVSRVLVGLKDGKMDDNSRKVVEAVERVRGVMSGQEASAAHRLNRATNVEDQTSLFIPMKQGLTPEQARTLSDIANRNGFDISDTGEGVTLLNHRDIGGSNADAAPGTGELLKKALKEKLGAELASAGFPVTDLRMGQLDSVYEHTGLTDLPQNSGEVTRGMLAQLDKAGPALEASLGDSPEVRERVLQMMDRDAQIAQSMGLVPREDLQKLRQIFAQGGFKGVREALAAGVVLPAAAMMILKNDPSQAPQQQQGTPRMF